LIKLAAWLPIFQCELCSYSCCGYYDDVGDDPDADDADDDASAGKSTAAAASSRIIDVHIQTAAGRVSQQPATPVHR